MVSGVAAVSAVALLLAINYCACEAFGAPHTHEEPTARQASTCHHEQDAPASQDHADVCCSTLQAVAVSGASLQLSGAAGPGPAIHHPTDIDAASAAMRLVTVMGLSPPTQAPIPRRHFYRIAFASHAPPVCLA